MSCVFCEINSDGSELARLPHNQHIMNTSSFYTVAGRGQICRGYAIICAKNHVSNLSLLDRNCQEELSIIKQQFCNASLSLYGCQPVFFEHGDANSYNRGGSCISHAHLHVVPQPMNFLPKKLIDHSAVQFCDMESANRYMQNNSPYFFLQLSNKEIYVLKSEALPCQFGRQLLCSELNLSTHWDWRTNLDSEAMLQTIQDYNSYFNSAY